MVWEGVAEGMDMGQELNWFGIVMSTCGLSVAELCVHHTGPKIRASKLT